MEQNKAGLLWRFIISSVRRIGGAGQKRHTATAGATRVVACDSEVAARVCRFKAMTTQRRRGSHLAGLFGQQSKLDASMAE